MLTTSYTAWLEEQEELTTPRMTAGEYDREETYIGGANHPDREWLLSDRDCWYRNPHFTGTPTKGHPEDDGDRYYASMSDEERAEYDKQAAAFHEEIERENERRREAARLSALEDGDIPF